MCPLNLTELTDERFALQIALQRALLGMVTENWWAVTAGIDRDRHVTIVGYFRDEVGETESADLEEVATEVVSSLRQPRVVDGQEIFAAAEAVARRARDSRPLRPLDFWAFVAKDAVPYLDHRPNRRV